MFGAARGPSSPRAQRAVSFRKLATPSGVPSSPYACASAASPASKRPPPSEGPAACQTGRAGGKGVDAARNESVSRRGWLGKRPGGGTDCPIGRKGYRCVLAWLPVSLPCDCLRCAVMRTSWRNLPTSVIVQALRLPWMRSHANAPLSGLSLCGRSGVGMLEIWLSVRACLSARGNLLSGAFGCLGTYPAAAFMSL